MLFTRDLFTGNLLCLHLHRLVIFLRLNTVCGNPLYFTEIPSNDSRFLFQKILRLPIALNLARRNDLRFPGRKNLLPFQLLTRFFLTDNYFAASNAESHTGSGKTSSHPLFVTLFALRRLAI